MKIDTTTPEGKELYNKVDSFLKERIKAKSMKYFIREDYILILSTSANIYTSILIQGLYSIIKYKFVSFDIVNGKSVLAFCLNVEGVKNNYNEVNEL